MAGATICRHGAARVLSFEGFLRRRERLEGGDAHDDPEVESPFTRSPLLRALTPKQVVHRQTMLGHLRRHDRG